MKLFAWLLSALLLTAFFWGAVNIVYAAPARTVRIGAYDNNPKIFKDVNDRTLGVYPDILSYIAKKENWNITYVWGTWDEGLTRLQKSQIDIMVDVAVSPERQKIYDFTNETVLNSWAVVYVRKDSTIDSLLGLRGKKISILKSSVYESGTDSIKQDLKAFGVNATVVEVNNYRSALDYLELGKTDAAIISYVSGLAIEKDYSNIKSTNIFLKPTELRFALTKGAPGNAYLIDRLDYWVGKLKAGQDGYYNQTLEKYGLGSLESQASQTQPFNITIAPCWVVPTALGAGVTLVLVILLESLLYGWPFRILRKRR